LNQLVEKHTHEIEKLNETKKFSESNRISPPKKEFNSSQKLVEALEQNLKSNESTVSFSPEKSRKFESNQLAQFQSEQKDRTESPSKKVSEPQLSLDKANASIYQLKSEIEHLKNIIHNLDARLKVKVSTCLTLRRMT
jgi:chromosome segregation ATPase